MSEYSELKAAALAATQADWEFIAVPVMGSFGATAEIAKLVIGTGQAEMLYMINADGLCPALTGTCPNAANNARFLEQSQPKVIISLLAALEEKDRQHRLHAARLIDERGQLRRRAEAAEQQITSLFERVSGEQVSNYPAGSIDWLADIIEGELDASEGALTAMRTRADAAEQRLQQPAVADVMAERQRQISAEGWTQERDDQYQDNELACAAATYAAHWCWTDEPPSIWPWAEEWWKPSKDVRRNMVKAGALILAEIERLDRAAVKVEGE